MKRGRAAFVFKTGENRSDYERALPSLDRYYRAIANLSATRFDVERKAQLELEWWIVHREHAGETADVLVRALAEAAAALYNVSPDSLQKYATLRAEAMAIRDTKSITGGVTEEDWQKIEKLLRESWAALRQVLDRQEISLSIN